MLNKKTLIASIAIAAVVGGVGTAAYFLNQEEKVYITEENYEQIKEETDEKVESGYFETYMTTSWTFADGESASKDAVLGNSPANTLPIRCVVTLNDTGEVVLETGAIPVGAELPDIILEKDLDPGKYDAVCTIYLLTETENGYEEFSNAGFNITITVEN